MKPRAMAEIIERACNEEKLTKEEVRRLGAYTSALLDFAGDTAVKKARKRVGTVAGFKSGKIRGTTATERNQILVATAEEIIRELFAAMKLPVSMTDLINMVRGRVDDGRGDGAYRNALRDVDRS